MPFMNGEVALRKGMMDIDTLGSSRQRGSQNLEELASGDYTIFGALI